MKGYLKGTVLASSLLMANTVFAAANIVICNACSPAQAESTAQVNAYLTYPPQCTSEKPCAPVAGGGQSSSVSGNETPNYVWPVHVYDFTFNKLYKFDVDTYQGVISEGVPASEIANELKIAKQYVDFFSAASSPEHSYKLDLGRNFPVASAVDVVGNARNTDLVGEAIADHIRNASPIQAVQHDSSLASIQQLAIQIPGLVVFYFSVVFPDRSTGVIQVTNLPTLSVADLLLEFKVLDGSLRDKNGKLVPKNPTRVSGLQ